MQFDLHIVIWVFEEGPEQSDPIQVSDLRKTNFIRDLRSGGREGDIKTFDLGVNKETLKLSIWDPALEFEIGFTGSVDGMGALKLLLVKTALISKKS